MKPLVCRRSLDLASVLVTIAAGLGGRRPLPTRERTETTMSGRVCIVTGANTGIGKATATQLARQGAHVVLACRSVSRVRRPVDGMVACLLAKLRSSLQVQKRDKGLELETSDQSLGLIRWRSCSRLCGCSSQFLEA